MRKMILCVWSGFLVFALTGCEVLMDGSTLTFRHGNNQTSITIGGLIFLAVITLLILWWLYRVLKRFYIHEKSDLWMSVEAAIVDKNMDYQNDSATRRTRYGNMKYKDYKIEYYIDGKLYSTYLNGADLIGCDETVEIECLKKRPTIIRIKKEK